MDRALSRVDVRSFLETVLDFAGKVEDIAFAVIPAVCVIVAAPRHVCKITNSTPAVRHGFLIWIKVALSLALVSVYLASIINWATNELFSANVSLLATVFSCLASFCIIVVLYAEHLYSVQAPPFLARFLGATLLLDGSKSYQCFKNSGLEPLGGVFAALVALKLPLLVAEQLSKQQRLPSTRIKDPLGQSSDSGFWNRSLFLWLNSVLVIGFRQALTINQLPPIEFDSESLYNAFLSHWEKCNYPNFMICFFSGADALVRHSRHVFATCLGHLLLQHSFRRLLFCRLASIVLYGFQVCSAFYITRGHKNRFKKCTAYYCPLLSHRSNWASVRGHSCE